jgi:tyrosine-protein kinase Etk/Wzc
MEHIPTQNPIMEEENFNIKKEVAYYGFFWPWFVLTILIALATAFFYLRYTDTVYESTAQIQIKTDADPASFLTGDLELFGMDQVTVENDMAVITSQHILSQVVKKLVLQTCVLAQGRIKSSLQIKEFLPFDVNFDNLETEQE